MVMTQNVRTKSGRMPRLKSVANNYSKPEGGDVREYCNNYNFIPE